IWEAQVTERKDEAVGIAKQSGELDTLQDEIGVLDGISKQVAAKIEAIQVELEAPPRIETREEAAVSEGEDRRRPLKMGGAAGLGVFACIVLAVSLVEFRSRRVSTVDEVVQGLKMRLVGTVPQLTQRNGRGLFGSSRQANQQNVLAESIDATRTMLLHAARAEGLRGGMVTSALQGGGKTSLSSHL